MNLYRRKQIALIREDVKKQKEAAKVEFDKEAQRLEEEEKTWWVKVSTNSKGEVFKCRFCNTNAYYVDAGARGKEPIRTRSECGYNFCPNCGKDMRK